ncbi:MAG TPA: aconitate hydratase [Spirochaetota bacterium]|nr:aconitate hydratase [Spirochaetota bacterium]HOM37869.1 aconitate hydratase [Spirochaetota bacterium]HPQ48673.1 aconitate hydratase [Spirochaetota bacterium]
MGKNIVEKIIEKHLVENYNDEIGIKIDQTLTQDATGTMVYLQLEAIGIEKIKTELSVSYVDHNTLQDGFENADDHNYLRSVAKKFGVVFSQAGNGICHQVHLERFAAPGKTLLGSDSHTPTAGGIGMLAIGAGGLDVASAMAGSPFYLKYPKVIKIELNGRLKPFVSAKDIILKVLEILTTKGNVGYIIEYGGEGIKTLSVPERATITNMGAELGVTTSIFPSDEVTYEFMKAQGREKDFVELLPDKDAKYDKIIKISLDELEPMVALPHSPDNVKKVKEIENLKVNQVLIGSCTNGSYKDMMITSHMLKGLKIAPWVSFGVAPGSRQVLEMVTENGAIVNIIRSGARILELACGFCIGAGQAPSSKGISIRTNNRNFKGRSGTVDAEVYLVSPETAVASAVKGFLTDPRDFAKEYGIEEFKFSIPSKFWVDDSQFLYPENNPEENIIRGPNIGNPPYNEPLSKDIKGVVTIKVGDKITTDHIMPAGYRLKYRSNIQKYSTFVFEEIKPDFYKVATENKNRGLNNIIIAGLSYGQGSSREHAAMCPMYLGVKMVIAKSIERIHRDNLINFGIIPATFVNESDYDRIEEGELIEINDIQSIIVSKNEFDVFNKTKNYYFKIKIDLSDRERDIIKLGGKLNYIKIRYNK